MEARNATTPVIQVIARRPRQAAIQNFPHRWMTMKTKNSWTLQKCMLLVNRPERRRVVPGWTGEGEHEARREHERIDRPTVSSPSRTPPSFRSVQILTT